MTATTKASKKSVAYLGPKGTFCEAATLSQADLADLKLSPQRSISDVFNAVSSGDFKYGVVPLENTIEGSVDVTLDNLAFDADVQIQREIDHDISLCIATRNGVKKKDIQIIVSHPHALAQCQAYFKNAFPKATTRTYDSTASAAQYVSKSSDKDLAVICALETAKQYDLEIIDSKIQDKAKNQTRFVLLGKGIPKPTGHDKTSIVCFQRSNRPGSLLAILSEFAARNIDLTKLESRPTKEGLGQYCFLIDFIGHVADDLVSDCLQHVRTYHADVKFLGSYPVAGDAGKEKRANTSKAWKDTKKWLSELRANIEEDK